MNELEKARLRKIVHLVVTKPSIEFVNIIIDKLIELKPKEVVVFIKEEYAK
jgi:hypothetical protein